MIKAIIIEDEKRAVNALKTLVADYVSNVSIVETFTKVHDAVVYINSESIDLVFLDIHLPRESGFELFTYFPDPNFYTIFTTAYSEYTLKALRLSAVDYLLKPIDKDELIHAVTKVEKLQMESKSNLEKEQLYTLMSEVSSKIALPTSNGYKFIKYQDILYCEANRNYTDFYFDDGSKHLVSKNIKTFEDQLSKHSFIRINRSYIINIEKVMAYSRANGGEVTMSNDTVIGVSKQIKEEFLKRLNL